MNPQLKKFSFLFFPLSLAVAYYFVGPFCDRQTDGFSVARIHSELPYNPAWETPPPTDEIQKELDAALSQKFHYLACGGQCFAFSSEDGNYVIKFFKHRIRKPYSYLLYAKLPGIFGEMQKRKLDRALVKLTRDFTSYKIAYEDLLEETALIYLHLNKGTHLNRTVTIVDKIGIAHQISLDGIEFIVQKKAQLVYPHIADLMKAGKTADVRQSFRAVLNVIVSRCKKGVFDEDPKIHRNLGFLGDKPIFIDTGRFIRDSNRKDPAIYKNDLAVIIKSFRKWLTDTRPELVGILDEEIREFQTHH